MYVNLCVIVIAMMTISLERKYFMPIWFHFSLHHGLPKCRRKFLWKLLLASQGHHFSLNFLGNASSASLILSNIWPDIMSNCCVKSLAAPAQTLIHSSTTVSNFFCGINMICELWLHLFAGELCTL